MLPGCLPRGKGPGTASSSSGWGGGHQAEAGILPAVLESGSCRLRGTAGHGSGLRSQLPTAHTPLPESHPTCPSMTQPQWGCLLSGPGANTAPAVLSTEPDLTLEAGQRSPRPQTTRSEPRPLQPKVSAGPWESTLWPSGSGPSGGPLGDREQEQLRKPACLRPGSAGLMLDLQLVFGCAAACVGHQETTQDGSRAGTPQVTGPRTPQKPWGATIPHQARTRHCRRTSGTQCGRACQRNGRHGPTPGIGEQVGRNHKIRMRKVITKHRN